ncbi:MAG: quinone oxidoreductase [Dehalococcoidia bacterium]
MKAIRVHNYGGPEVLTYEDVPDPVPGPGEALIKMSIIGVNFSDTHTRNGSSNRPTPVVPGHEGTGTIAALGEGDSAFKVGDRVVFAGQHHLGTYKELMTIPTDALVPIPAGIDSKLAVAVMNQGQTAHYLVNEAYPVQSGDRVLIHAGAGGVGMNLIQMAKMRGGYVYTTVSSQEKADFARDLGADEVIMYTQTDFVDEIKQRTNGKGVAAVYDAIGGDNVIKSIECLEAKGYCVTYGQSSGGPTKMEWPVRGGRGPRSYYLSIHTGADYSRGEENIRTAHEIFRWVREGALKVHIHAEYPLAEAAKAHEAIESRGTIGKLLLIP